MSAEAFELKVRDLLRKQPFQPFQIEFEDGDRFVVGDPKALWYHMGDSAVFFRHDGSFDFIYSEAVRDFIELVPASTSKS
jgi:hypothetical protein